MSVADDVAALRSMIERCSDDEDVTQAGMLEILDRIAGAPPQRAIGRGAKSLWMHGTCGTVTSRTIGPALTRCEGCGMSTDKWRALYVLPVR